MIQLKYWIFYLYNNENAKRYVMDNIYLIECYNIDYGGSL